MDSTTPIPLTFNTLPTNHSTTQGPAMQTNPQPLPAPNSDYQLVYEGITSLLAPVIESLVYLISEAQQVFYDTANGSITLAGHSAILAFCLITIHTTAAYLYLTKTMITVQRRYHSNLDGHTPAQVFHALLMARAHTKGMTLWLRKNGSFKATHLLHIKRPCNLIEYLVPRIRIVEKSKLKTN